MCCITGLCTSEKHLPQIYVYISVCMVFWHTIPFIFFFVFVLLPDFRSCTGLVSKDKIPQVVTRFYHSPPTFEVVLTRFGSFHLTYLLAINQALPYGCNFVIYGHPVRVLQQVTLPSFGMMNSNSQYMEARGHDSRRIQGHFAEIANMRRKYSSKKIERGNKQWKYKSTFFHQALRTNISRH